MPTVTAKRHESFEGLLRRFKKSVEKSDLMKDLRDREFYEKPSSKRKRAGAAANKRTQRQREESNLHTKRLY
jgi:small subunit ribosomal protein S21